MSVILAGEAERLIRARNDQISLAWHIESLARQERLPRLERLLTKKKAKPKSPAELELVTRSWLSGAARRRKRVIDGAIPTAE